MIGAVDGQVVRALGACPGGLRRKDLFPLCDSAAEELDVSAALKRLKDDGYVEVASERKGATGAVYVLTGKGTEMLNAQALPVSEKLPSAAAGLVDAVSSAGEKLSTAAAGLLGHAGESGDQADIDVDYFDVIMKSLVEIKKQVNERRMIDDLDAKLKCLNKLAVLLNRDDAVLLYAVMQDLEAA